MDAEGRGRRLRDDYAKAQTHYNFYFNYLRYRWSYAATDKAFRDWAED